MNVWTPFESSAFFVDFTFTDFEVLYISEPDIIDYTILFIIGDDPITYLMDDGLYVGTETDNPERGMYFIIRLTGNIITE